MTTNPRRILLCDDDEFVREVVEAALRAGGFDCVSTGTAEAALREFSAAPGEFALAIVDRRLPGFDGVALIGLLRALRADLPVLLASGAHAASSELEHLPGPPVGLLHKPFRPSALRLAVTDLLAAR